ncbi:MAG: hypothetical protein JXR60_01370 [Bacteroidales bacterium]|nr:hypothetical protein [Bacteroidales bacterium]
MRPLFLIFFLLSINLIIRAQDLIYQKTSTYNAGFYLSFDEFRFGKPSMPLNYPIDRTQLPADSLDLSIIYPYSFFSAEDNAFYKIVFPDSLKATIPKIWGFSDGESIYYNFLEKWSAEVHFQKLINVGVYSISWQLLDRLTSSFSGALPEKKHTCNCEKDYEIQMLLLSISDGEVQILNFENVRSILLKNDSVLYHDLISGNSEQTIETSYQYITLFNKKHRFEKVEILPATFQLEDAVNLILKTKKDKSIELYCNRVYDQIKNNKAFSEAEIVRQYHKNNQLKSIGIETKHIFSLTNEKLPIGFWAFYNKTGKLEKIIQYNLFGTNLQTIKKP